MNLESFLTFYFRLVNQQKLEYFDTTSFLKTLEIAHLIDYCWSMLILHPFHLKEHSISSKYCHVKLTVDRLILHSNVFRIDSNNVSYRLSKQCICTAYLCQTNYSTLFTLAIIIN